MGTNYYLRLGVCPQCGRAAEELHIGKSSAGWCFALHVGGDCPSDLPSWYERIQLELARGGRITDEYGEDMSLADLKAEIEERSWTPPRKRSRIRCAASRTPDNCAVRGPNGLLRSVVDGRHCIGHGEGTWDLITGEFS